jgi:hypothetical protein
MKTPTLPHQPSGRPVFASELARPFIDEWHRLARSRRVRITIATWELPDGRPVSDLEDLLERLGFFGRPDDEAADSALFHVVRLAADDLLAARVVLQRVLPALVSVARRRGGVGRSARDVAFAEVVSAAWIVIRTYPVARRPARVAANIVRDAEYHAFVRPRRLRSGSEEVGRLPVEADGEAGRFGAPEDREPEPMDEVLELLRDARDAGVSTDDLRFVGGLISGRTSAELAAELGVCERSVRYRRAAVTSRLRAVALDERVAA